MNLDNYSQKYGNMGVTMQLKTMLFVLISILVFGCQNDDNNIEVGDFGCLQNVQITVSDFDCETSLNGGDCEEVYLGAKQLTESAKTGFGEYCQMIGSSTQFRDSNEDTISVVLTEKRFNRIPYNVTSRFNADSCREYCLDAERAEIDLISDRFALRLILSNAIGSGFSNGNSDEKIVTQYVVWAKLGNTAQTIFVLPFLDYNDDPVFPDTSRRIKYINEFEGNGVMFNDVFTNEGYVSPTLKRKEVVYFSLEEGLVAVRDSMGVLWSIIR